MTCTKKRVVHRSLDPEWVEIVVGVVGDSDSVIPKFNNFGVSIAIRPNCHGLHDYFTEKFINVIIEVYEAINVYHSNRIITRIMSRNQTEQNLLKYFKAR